MASLLSRRLYLPPLCSPRAVRTLSTVPPPPSAPYRILFMGADEFSCASLRAIHAARQGLIQEIVVVTPPESRTGRGLKDVHIPPLRILAEKFKIRNISLPSTGLRGWEPPPGFSSPSPSNLLLTASFGHLIPSSLLSRFLPLNTINVHPSLLPKYRGAAPIQWALINGDAETGVSIQELSRGTFDKGRILGQSHFTIPPDSTFSTLEPLLGEAGGALLTQVLQNLPAIQLMATTQDPSLASSAPKITKEMARIDWESSRESIQRLQRGIAHHYPLWTTLAGGESPGIPSSPIQLEVSTDPLPTSDASSSGFPTSFSSNTPGTVALLPKSRQVVVLCCRGGENRIGVIERVKVSGRRWVAAYDWWQSLGKNPVVRFK